MDAQSPNHWTTREFPWILSAYALLSMNNNIYNIVDEQPLTGECWIPQKNDTPHSRATEKPQQDGRRGKIIFRIKPYSHQRHLEGSNKTLCIPGPRDPTETEPDLCLSLLWRHESSVACLRGEGSGCSYLGHTACDISPLGRSSPLTPPQSHQADDPQTSE